MSKVLLENKILLLLYDLYWLRHRKKGEQWYELTDYLKDKLEKEFHLKISYTKNDLIVFIKGLTFSIRGLLKNKDGNNKTTRDI